MTSSVVRPSLALLLLFASSASANFLPRGPGVSLKNCLITSGTVPETLQDRSFGSLEKRGDCDVICDSTSCCPSGYYCDTVFGIPGCCENGKVCTGVSNECADDSWISCGTYCCLSTQVCSLGSCSAGGGGGGGGGGGNDVTTTYFEETTTVHTTSTSHVVVANVPSSSSSSTTRSTTRSSSTSSRTSSTLPTSTSALGSGSSNSVGGSVEGIDRNKKFALLGLVLAIGAFVIV
ncbi:hypothetical protein FRC16_002544 [Serendipita sp. 398]|nr:hypothetical protein FRC16_002544 [Serendipita sp. 398]